MFRAKSKDRTAKEEEQIRRFEEQALASPQTYRRKVIAAAAGGYLVPFGFLALLAGIVVFGGFHILGGGSGAAAVVKLSIAAGALGFAVAKSMVVRFDPPQARRIERGNAPELFKKIDEIRTQMKGPDIHEVYLDDQLNASIEQSPRYGIFGGHINRLVIGLPLMQALSTRQFTSVLAHEYGHLAGSHGKTSAWIYRTRVMWSQLWERLHERGTLLDLPLIFFVDRFAPWFDRMSFPLARANEYEADRAAADLVSGQTAADALIRVSLAARYLDEVFWPNVDKHARTCAKPNVAPLGHSHKAFAGMRKWKKSESWMAECLTRETDFADTHPSIKNRIEALNAAPRVAPIDEARSIDLLGDFYETARAEFDKAWRDKASDNWAAIHETTQRELKRLTDLDTLAEEQNLSRSEALERGHLAEMHLTPEAAIHRYKEAVIWEDENAVAWLNLGRLLAERGEEQAVKCLTRAKQLDERLGLPVASTLYHYKVKTGKMNEAQKAMEDIQEEERRHAQAETEVYQISKDQELAPHDLTDEALGDVVAKINALGDVKQAFLVVKQSTVFSSYRGYHLILDVKSPKTFDYEAASTALRALSFNGDLFFWFAVGENKWMTRKMKKIEGAKLDLSVPQQTQLAA